MGSTLSVWLKERNGKWHSGVTMACISTGLCPSGFISTFQSIIKGIFRDLLDEGVITYLDDILIYSEDEESHIDLVK
jgi:hypothetical protein